MKVLSVKEFMLKHQHIFVMSTWKNSDLNSKYRISTNSFRGNYSFWKWKMWKFSYSFRIYGNFLLHKLNSCSRKYSRGETIQGRKLFAEIR